MLPGCAFSLHRSACDCRGPEQLPGCMAYSTGRPAGMPSNIAGMHVPAGLCPTAMSLPTPGLQHETC